MVDKTMGKSPSIKHDGVPITGFTWYGLQHQVDWDSALRENAGIIDDLGLYDLKRKITPVGIAYRDLIKKWKNTINDEIFGLSFHH